MAQIEGRGDYPTSAVDFALAVYEQTALSAYFYD